MSRSKMKTVLDLLFDIRNIIHFESVPEGTTVHQTFSAEVVKWLTDAVRSKRR
jgi:hypothetical protein